MSYNSKYTGAEVEALLDSANGKQDKIEDLDAIRSGALKGATALQSIPSEYVTESELTSKGYATASSLNDKVDKVSGKGLSTEDFTTALKTKLEGLNNYNDAEISNAVSSLQTQLNTLVSGNANDAINSFNEIIAFLDGVKDTQDLASIIASIEQQIAAKMDNIADLETIRSGAAKGATALQSYTEKYTGTITGITMNGASKGTSGIVDLGTVITDISGKVDKVAGMGLSTYDFNDGWADKITESEEAIAKKYSKPSDGIPRTDLSQDVQNLLSKAGTSIQTTEFAGIQNIARVEGFESIQGNILYALPDTATGDEDDIIATINTLKTINGQSIVGSGDITIKERELEKYATDKSWSIVASSLLELVAEYGNAPDGTKAIVVEDANSLYGVNLFDSLMGNVDGVVDALINPNAFTLEISAIDTSVELPVSITSDVRVELPFNNTIYIDMGADMASIYRIYVQAGFTESVWGEGDWHDTSYMIGNKIPLSRFDNLDDNAAAGLLAIAPALIVDFVGTRTITEYVKNGDNWEVWSEGESGLNTKLNEWLEQIAQLLPTKTSQLENDSNFITSDGLKTINGQSLLGSGDIVISGGEGGGTDLTENDDITVRDINARDITADSLYGKVYADVISDSYGTKALSIINEGILIQGHANNEVILQTVTSGSGTKFLSDDGTYKTISGGGSGEDIRYFTDFTVEDFIEACENGDTITYDTTELFNAMKSNKVICVPYRGYDKGFIVASYKSGEDEEYQSMYLQKGDIEYYAWTGDSHELVGELPTYNSVQVVEVAGGEVFLAVLDNHIYKITDPVDYLLPFFDNIQKGTTIHFMSGESGTTMDMYNVFWANGEIPQIEPNTHYELSVMQNAFGDCNMVLTPFKSVE